jgi:5-azacytidine-induced protein 1
LVVLEGDNKRLRNELSEERALHKFDVDKMRQGKEDEMEELHKRVKKAIANKDENTKILKDKMLAAEKRAEHLEQLLADQRKKILDE